MDLYTIAYVQAMVEAACIDPFHEQYGGHVSNYVYHTPACLHTHGMCGTTAATSLQSDQPPHVHTLAQQDMSLP